MNKSDLSNLISVAFLCSPNLYKSCDLKLCRIHVTVEAVTTGSKKEMQIVMKPRAFGFQKMKHLLSQE